MTAAWLLFGLLNTWIRVGEGANLAAADALTMVAAQELQIAYQVGQPPLFDWLVWLMQQATGPVAASVYVVKYMLMLVAGLSVYVAISRITDRPEIAGVASLSLMVLFNVGFTIHDQSTHSVAMIAAIGVTFLGFVLVVEYGRPADYLVLGFGISAGLLSKYGFVVFPAAMTLALLASPALRPRILSPRLLIALVIPVLTVAPFLAWLYARRELFADKLERTLLDHVPGLQLDTVASGVTQLIGSYAVYAAPAVPLLWLVWPLLPLRWPTWQGVQAGKLRDVIGLSLIIAFAAALLLIIVTDTETMRSRYMHALALLLPVYVALFIQPEELTRSRLTLFVVLVATLQAAQILTRAVTPLVPVAPFCERCGVIEPLEVLAGGLEARGHARSTLHVPDHRIAGNLRRLLPEARVTTSRLKLAAATRIGPRRPCIKVTELRATAVPTGTDDVITAAWPVNRFAPDRTSRWQITKLPSIDPRCR